MSELPGAGANMALNKRVGHEKARTIRRMFAAISPRYDLLNSLFSAGLDSMWRRRAAAAVDVPSGGVILDLCTGTGKLAHHLRGRFPDATVIGIDFCPDMLVRARNADGVALVGGDALRLPVADDTCDLVTVAFGIRNFADLNSGLREIHRALRPGGTVVFLELFMPKSWLVRQPYSLYLGTLMPFMGELVSDARGSYSYLRDSIKAFCSPEELMQVMTEAGFRNISYKLLTGGVAGLHVGLKES